MFLLLSPIAAVAQGPVGVPGSIPGSGSFSGSPGFRGAGGNETGFGGSGAASSASRAMANPSAGPVAPAGTGKAISDNYVLSTNDSIHIEVYQEEDMTTSARVNKDGFIIVPLIGQVKVAGMTTQQLTGRLRELLSKDYFVNPAVSVTVTDYTHKHFIILGQVNAPGTYEIPSQETITLVQAIAMAGGFTRIASPGGVRIARHTEGKEENFKVDAKKMIKDSREKAFEVEPGDVITVPESFF